MCLEALDVGDETVHNGGPRLEREIEIHTDRESIERQREKQHKDHIRAPHLNAKNADALHHTHVTDEVRYFVQCLVPDRCAEEGQLDLFVLVAVVQLVHALPEKLYTGVSGMEKEAETRERTHTTQLRDSRKRQTKKKKRAKEQQEGKECHSHLVALLLWHEIHLVNEHKHLGVFGVLCDGFYARVKVTEVLL